MTMQRRAADRGEPTNADILRRIESIETKLDDLTKAYREEQAEQDKVLAALQSAAILREHRLVTLEGKAIEIGTLHDFKVQLETMGRMTRFVVGGSVMTFIAAVISLIVSLAHVGAGG